MMGMWAKINPIEEEVEAAIYQEDVAQYVSELTRIQSILEDQLHTTRLLLSRISWLPNKPTEEEE
jgi:hypothetical protein